MITETDGVSELHVLRGTISMILGIIPIKTVLCQSILMKNNGLKIGISIPVRPTEK